MKILFFVASLYSGGRERRIIELLKGIAELYPELNCEIVITRKEIHYKEIFNLGVKIHIIERKKGFKKDPLLFYEFYKIAWKFKPDIIHVWGNMVAIYSIPTKLLLRVPLINSQITDAPSFIKKNLLDHKLTFPFSDIILANSFSGLNAYRAPLKKSKVIYNGFDFHRVKNVKLKTIVKDDLGIKEKYIIGMVASFSKNKDYDTFLKAAKIIREKRNDIGFICIGDGSFKKDMEYKFQDVVNNGGIYFLGRLNKVESIINICDVGVLTTNSSIHGEGISNSLMEFMALGRVVIATDSGGTKELLLDKKTGYLIKPFSYNELVEKIIFLIENMDIANKMGKMGRKRIVEKFDIKKMINSFVTVYKQLENNEK